MAGHPVAVFGVGSTNFYYGIGYPDRGDLEALRRERTQADRLHSQIADALDGLEARTDRSLTAVAVASPGLVGDGVIRKFDTRDGDVIDRIELAGPIEREYGLPVYLENDCNAAALAEWYYGAGQRYRSLAHVTFGTGIGVGIVSDGRLLRGESGQAGEFGLVSLDPLAEVESTGVPGAWEAFCSGRGIAAYLDRELKRETPESSLREVPHLRAQDVFEAAADGDAFADEQLARIGRYNAAGIAAIANAVNPGVITVGGGVALNNHRLLEDVHEHLPTYCFSDVPELRMTPLGEEIGVYGALAAVTHGASTVRDVGITAATED